MEGKSQYWRKKARAKLRQKKKFCVMRRENIGISYDSKAAGNKLKSAFKTLAGLFNCPVF